MADSEVSIANSALTKIGASRILTLTDNTKSAITINEQYNKVRKKTLRSHPWNFAIERIALVEALPVPVSGYSHKYQLPTDCLRILLVTATNDDLDLIDYRVEGKTILCAESSCWIKYIKDVTDTTQFDPMFDEAFACALAADIAYIITQNANMTQMATGLFLQAIREARGVDAFEDHVDAIDDDSWIIRRR